MTNLISPKELDLMSNPDAYFLDYWELDDVLKFINLPDPREREQEWK